MFYFRYFSPFAALEFRVSPSGTHSRNWEEFTMALHFTPRKPRAEQIRDLEQE